MQRALSDRYLQSNRSENMRETLETKQTEMLEALCMETFFLCHTYKKDMVIPFFIIVEGVISADMLIMIERF